MKGEATPGQSDRAWTNLKRGEHVLGQSDDSRPAGPMAPSTPAHRVSKSIEELPQFVTRFQRGTTEVRPNLVLGRESKPAAALDLPEGVDAPDLFDRRRHLGQEQPC
jgi:hypothetical protein